MNKKISLLGLIGITLAFFGSVRSVPSVAATGWEMIIYMLIAGVLFALPIAMVSAEMSTIWSDSGGPQVWVMNGLGDKWGFVVSWLLWLQMFFGMAMVSSTFSVMLGNVLGIEAMRHNNFVVFLVILCIYWFVTILNLKVDMLKIQGGWGAIIGVYVPFIVITILGFIFFAKHGINPNGYLADFTPGKLLPNLSDPGTLPIFVGIIFIFAGVEMSSVHVNEIDNPTKNYPIAVILAVILVVAFNLMAGLGVANAIPTGQAELSNIMESVDIITEDFGLPLLFDKALAVCILIGIFVSLSSWVLGPSKSMQHVADEGSLPPFFQKRNAKGDPVNLVLVQALAVSSIACLFLIPGINVDSIFLLITVTTTLIYCVVYILILVSAIRLRYVDPNLPRAFRLGKTGNSVIWAVAGTALLIIALVVMISLIPPASIPAEDHIGYIAFQIIALSAAVGSGLLVHKFKKPEWKQENQTKNS